jgi:hypothetical protein
VARIERKNYLKAKLWTSDGGTMETEGGTVGVIDLLFTAMPSNHRALLLEKLQATNERMRAREAVTSEVPTP